MQIVMHAFYFNIMLMLSRINVNLLYELGSWESRKLPLEILLLIVMEKLKRAYYRRLVGLSFFVLLLSQIAVGQLTVNGTVVDGTSNTPLIGARVMLKGAMIGAMTDNDGKFSFQVPGPTPFELVVTYIGFDTLYFNVDRVDKVLKLKMDEATLSLDEVQITASAQAEAQKRSPLTVESMSVNAIKETPAANFYEGLGHLKGVDLNSASFGFKVVNTRGFNSTQPVRSLQLIDGVDNQSPGLNFSLGNFLGASELDLESVTLVVGASSAFYGPNAFNGVISMKTKSPFVHRGLQVSMKLGERNWLETAIRYAKVFKNKKGEDKFAIKLNAYYMQADDWEADNFDEAYRDTSDIGTTPFVGIDNPGGYDAVNVYGDEVSYDLGITGNDRINNPGLNRIFRTGYKEADLLDYDTDNIKTSLSLHYKLKPEIELTAATSYSKGTTVFQGVNRISLRDIQFFQHKIELKEEGRFFIRSYVTHEDAGNSYDPVFTAFRLQNLALNDISWRNRYLDYYRLNIAPQVKAIEGYPAAPAPPRFIFDFNQQEQIIQANQGLLRQWHQETRTFTDATRLVPGTAAFEAAFDSITSRITSTEGGTRFFDESALYHVHGEYIFKPSFGEITVGANARQYAPNTAGSIFSDTADVKITNFEYGIYSGIKHSPSDDLTLTGTVRLDKNENFDFLVSPAATAVWNVDQNNTIRGSLSSAIRNPTLADQFLNYEIGGAVLLGNINGYEDLITLESFGEYLEDPSPANLNYFDVDPIQPEKVLTAEVGYRGMINNRVYIDGSYYYSRYTDFIGFQFGWAGTFIGQLPFGKVFRVSSNAQDVVTTQGAAIGLNYFLNSSLTVGGNYSWNRLNTQTDDPIIPAFNTPEHKFNLNFSGRNVTIGNIRNIGFNVNYKWVEGFLFEGSPQFTGIVPSYDRLDVQLNKYFPDIKATVKLGASNILDNRAFTVYGGPRIGRLAYASIAFDFPNL